MNITKITISITFSLLVLVSVFLFKNTGNQIIPPVVAEEISVENPLGTPSITTFFENLMTRLQSIIGYLTVLFIVISGVMYVISGMGGGNETMKKMAQNTLVFAVIGLAITVGGPTILKEIKYIVLGGESMPTNIQEAPTIMEIIGRALHFLLSIIGVLAIISLIMSGIVYLTSLGNTERANRATKMMTYSLIGIIITGLALIIVKKITELIQ